MPRRTLEVLVEVLYFALIGLIVGLLFYPTNSHSTEPLVISTEQCDVVAQDIYHIAKVAETGGAKITSDSLLKVNEKLFVDHLLFIQDYLYSDYAKQFSPQQHYHGYLDACFAFDGHLYLIEESIKEFLRQQQNLKAT